MKTDSHRTSDNQTVINWVGSTQIKQKLQSRYLACLP